jgi:hypothetical protein
VKAIYSQYSENCDVFPFNNGISDDSVEQMGKNSINDKIKLLSEVLQENSGKTCNFLLKMNSTR